MHTGSTSVRRVCFSYPIRRMRDLGPRRTRSGHSVRARGRRTAQGTQAQRNNQQRLTEGQRLPTPGRLVLPVTGTVGTATTAPEGEAAATPAVTGSFAIQRFARTIEDSVAAVGTLTLN